MNIAEFASELGVSPTTVSHALSGRGRISDATRRRVLARADELDYTPNSLAQRLATGRSRLITLDAVTEKLLTDFYSMQMARSIQHALQAHGYALTFNIVSDFAEQDSLLRRAVRSRATDGVISLGRFLDDRATLREIAAPHAPCVVISHTAIKNVPHVGSVVLDVGAGVRQAVAWLREYSHQRVGFIGFEEAHPKILRAFQRALARCDVMLREDNIQIVEQSAAGGAQGLRALMEKPAPPTAILVRNDVMALGALQQAKMLGLRVPQDVSILGHDDMPLAALSDPPLASIRIDYEAAGRAAVEILMQLLGEPHASARPRVIETQLVRRDSVGAAAK